MSVETMYNTEIVVNKIKVGWATEVSFEMDYNIQDESTHSGKIIRNSRYPSCDISITKLTKFEATSEKNFIKALECLATDGGTVTMTTKEPGGKLTINAYDCRIESQSWTNNADEFLEIELSLKGESWDIDWSAYGTTACTYF